MRPFLLASYAFSHFDMEAPLAFTQVPPLDNTLGCLLIGDIFASVLFGVATLQTYLYFDGCTDKRTLKFSVGLLWVLDAVHLSFAVHELYWYCVSNFMDPTKLAYYAWSLKGMLVTTAVSDAVLRSVYFHRIWSVTQKGLWRTSLIIVVSSGLMITNMAFIMVLITHQASYAEILKFEWVVCSILGSSAMTDIIIAAALCYALWCYRTKIRRTNGIIRVLMLYTINTGILTCSCNIAAIIAFVALPRSLVFSVFYIIMPKIYLNSLLAMLNARAKIRENMGGIISIPLTHRSEPDIHAATGEPPVENLKVNRDAFCTSVLVQVTTEVTTDNNPSL